MAIEVNEGPKKQLDRLGPAARSRPVNCGVSGKWSLSNLEVECERLFPS